MIEPLPAPPVDGPSFAASSLAGLLSIVHQARVLGDGCVVVRGVGNFDSPRSDDVTFLRSGAFLRAWLGDGPADGPGDGLSVQQGRLASGPSTAIVSAGLLGNEEARVVSLLGPRALIVVLDADLALIELLPRFAPRVVPAPAGVHPSSVVSAGVDIARSASVGPHCFLGAGTILGERCVLHAGVTLGQGVRIGAGSVLHPGVRVLDHCVVGRSCVLHANVVIGADGFGYRPRPDGRGLLKVPHIGNVILGDDVEIGANSCVDRAKIGSTTIGDGTKIDNLVQVAHNCVIGRACVICGQAGLAGSVRLGDGVVLAARVAIADNLKIGSGAKIGAASGVMNDVPAGQTWLGMPAAPAQDTLRMMAKMRRLGRGEGRGTT